VSIFLYLLNIFKLYKDDYDEIKNYNNLKYDTYENLTFFNSLVLMRIKIVIYKRL
jgi:hypothetical protein